MEFSLSYSRSQTQKANRGLLLSLIFLSISGCGSGQEKPKFFSELVPTTGRVTLDGKPLIGANVTFIPEQGEKDTRMASAVTKDSGEFELITPIANTSPEDSKGIAPGKYKVLISKFLMPDGSTIPADTMEADAMALGAKESLPAIYSNFEQSKLTAQVDKVSGKATNIDFDLVVKKK
jgi:hypothetical protein